MQGSTIKKDIGINTHIKSQKYPQTWGKSFEFRRQKEKKSKVLLELGSKKEWKCAYEYDPL